MKTLHYQKRENERDLIPRNPQRILPVDRYNLARKNENKVYTAAIYCENCTVIATARQENPIKLITIY